MLCYYYRMFGAAFATASRLSARLNRLRRERRLPGHLFWQPGQGPQKPPHVFQILRLPHHVQRAQRFPHVTLVGGQFGQRLAIPDVRHQGTRIHVVPQLQPVADRSGGGRAHRKRAQHGHQFAARRAVAKARERERRITPGNGAILGFMEKKKGRVPASPEKSVSAPPPAPPEASAAVPSLPWTLTWCVLSLLFLTLVWYPASKLSAHYSFGSNEGFNTTFAAQAAAGLKIYGNPPLYTYANYPPVSFHLIAWLSAITHDINLTGRWISFFAYLAIGGLIALIVQRLCRSWRHAAYSGLCWLIWIPAFDVGRVGLNDPHLLGVAFSLAGLYCFLRDPESTRWLCISAAVFAVSLFTKQSLVAFPAAVAIQLALASRRRFAIWLGAAAAACVVLLILTLAVDGKYFFDHLMLPRAYYISDIWSSLGSYLYFVQVPFVVAIVWACRVTSIGSTGFLLWGLPIALVVGAFYCGGAGAGVNHLFDAMILTAIIVGLALPGVGHSIEGSRFPRAALTFVLIVPCFLTSLVVLARRLPADFGHKPDELAQAEREFTGVSDFLRSRPGPALCESLLLCYAAGKPGTYDPFAADQLMRTGKIPQEQIVQLIAGRHFAAIQIDWNANEPMQPAPRTRFPGPVMRALFGSYQLALRSGKYAVFTPR